MGGSERSGGKVKLRFLFFTSLLFLIILGVFLFNFRSKPQDVVESISGFVSFVGLENGRTLLYLDVTPDYDTDAEGSNGNDKDVWVSAYNKRILNTLNGLRVGDWIYAKDLWKGDESVKAGINHYYILEIYEVKSS